MKRALLVTGLMSTLFAPALALAEDAIPLPTANIGLVSNYKYRGQDQTSNKPAVQGGFDWSYNGFYVGNWNSNVDFAGSLEMDFYGGYKGEVAGFGYDVGVLTYYYPEKDKETNINTTELYVGASYSIASLKYSHTVSKDYFGLGAAADVKGRNTGYWDLSANYEVIPSLTLNAHVGFTRYASDLKDNVVNDAGEHLPNYTDWKVGATYAFGTTGFSVAGAVVGATKKDFYGDINKTRFIVTLSKSM